MVYLLPSDLTAAGEGIAAKYVGASEGRRERDLSKIGFLV